jgi:hypothetical protein
MRRLAARAAVLILAVAAAATAAVLVACGAGTVPAALPPELLVGAGDRLARVDLASGRTLLWRLLPGPAIDLARSPDGALVGLATLRGAAFLDPDSLAVRWSENLGIVDAVEFAPDGAHAYFLLHPGDDPREASAEHTLLEVAVPGGAHGREARLPTRAYDLFLDAAGGAIYSTDLVGRTVHRVDLATFTVTDLEIGLGRAPAVEPEGAFVRVLLPGRTAGELFALEDTRGTPRLWRFEPATGKLEPHDLPGAKPPVLGGGPLGEGPGAGLWLFTRSQFLRLGADLRVTAETALALPDSSPGYHFAAADRSTCVLLAPGSPSRGAPQTRAAWIDLERGTEAGARLLDLRTGPFLLRPRPAAPREGPR